MLRSCLHATCLHSYTKLPPPPAHLPTRPRALLPTCPAALPQVAMLPLDIIIPNQAAFSCALPPSGRFEPGHRATSDHLPTIASLKDEVLVGDAGMSQCIRCTVWSECNLAGQALDAAEQCLAAAAAACLLLRPLRVLHTSPRLCLVRTLVALDVTNELHLPSHQIHPTPAQPPSLSCLVMSGHVWSCLAMSGHVWSACSAQQLHNQHSATQHHHPPQHPTCSLPPSPRRRSCPACSAPRRSCSWAQTARRTPSWPSPRTTCARTTDSWTSRVGDWPAMPPYVPPAWPAAPHTCLQHCIIAACTCRLLLPGEAW